VVKTKCGAGNPGTPTKAAFLALYAIFFPWPHIRYGWRPAWSLGALPQPSPAAFDAEPFLSASGSESRGIGPRLCPQALGSAWFIMSAPTNATAA
jgi:hypothetical protein